jgi:hypothetical protein
MALVGFFDILGTRDAVLKGRFSDHIARDFSGPAGLAAREFSSVRVAVFSDSVIVTAEAGAERAFLGAVGLMYGQWNADLILVRGGIAQGDIRWVDHESVDNLFGKYKNFQCSRIYGDGLVHAYELEQRSGPGAVAFLTESAANVLCTIDENSVMLGATPMLCWANQREAEILLNYAKAGVDREPEAGNARRHARATLFYWEQIASQRKYLPKGIGLYTTQKRPFVPI